MADDPALRRRDRVPDEGEPPAPAVGIGHGDEEIRGVGKMSVAAGDDALNVAKGIVCETSGGRSSRAVRHHVQHRFFRVGREEHVRRHLVAAQKTLEGGRSLAPSGGMPNDVSQMASSPVRIISANSSM